MGDTGTTGGAGGMGFLSDIPIWLFIVVVVLGLAIGGLLIFLHARAKPQPGVPKGATPQLIFGILSLVLLGLVPLIAMIIALTQDGGSGRDRRDRAYDEDSASDEPGDSVWRVRFESDGVVYTGQFEPRDGTGPLKVMYTSEGREARTRETCVLSGRRTVRITCSNPQMLVGGFNYSADNFELRWDGEDEMTGTLSSDQGSTGTATFTRGRDPRFDDPSWDAPARPSSVVSAPVEPGAAQGALAAQLAAAVAQQRSQLPVRNGPTTITAIEAVGTTVNLYVTISQDMSPAQWTQLEQVLRTSTCGGKFGRMIASGASISYQMLDAGEEQRALTVNSC